MTTAYPFRSDKFDAEPRKERRRHPRGKDTQAPPFRRRWRSPAGEFETLENRLVMAAPELVALLPNSGSPIRDNDILSTGPKELRFQFSEGQTLDVATVSSAIQITRANKDLTFGNGNDVPISLGFIGLGDKTNEIVARFSDTLPADTYQVTVFGAGVNALKNSTFEPFNNGVDKTIKFTLDLAPRVLSVIPQPISGAPGARTQQFDTVEVYFNNDDLNPVTANNPQHYQLINTATPTIAQVPISVNYDPILDRAQLRFAAPLAAGTYRLRIGNNDPVQNLPNNLTIPSDAGLNANSTISDSFNLGDLGATSLVLSSSIDPQNFDLDLPGSSREPGHRDLQIPLQQHVFNPANAPAPGIPDAVNGVTTITYTFSKNESYGRDPQSNAQLFSTITDSQMTRVREIFALYNKHFGLQFVESPTANGAQIWVVTGDLRVINPNIASAAGGITSLSGIGQTPGGQPIGLVVADGADFVNPTEPFAGAYFNTTMSSINFLLGMGRTEELPTTVNALGTNPLTADVALPSNQDIVHGQHLFRPDSKDVDVYQFRVTNAGFVSAEIAAERLSDRPGVSSSLLDSHLTLYKSTGEVIARNNDYFGRDAFVNVFLESGTYYIAVSAAGNDQFDPNVRDSGFGGTTQGAYELKLSLNTGASTQITDLSGFGLDGDADGIPTGEFNFWFKAGQTIYVDKAYTGSSGTPNGSLARPFTEIDQGIAAAVTGGAGIVRILANGGVDGRIGTLADNAEYQVGFSNTNTVLPDGSDLRVPRNVTVMVDAGAVIKLQGAVIEAGNSVVGQDRSGGALQFLGVNDNTDPGPAGPSFEVPSGALAFDGATFSINGITFELDNNATFVNTNRVITFTTGMSANTLASVIASAINRAGISGVTASASLDVVTLRSFTAITLVSAALGANAGPTLTLPDAVTLVDGRTFTLNNVTFEFDKNSTVANPTFRPIAIAANDTAAAVATKTATAINTANIFGIRAAVAVGNQVVILGNTTGFVLPVTLTTNTLVIGSGPQMLTPAGNAIGDGESFQINGTTFEFDRDGVFTNGSIRIAYTINDNAQAIAAAMALAITTANLQGVLATAGNNVLTLVGANQINVQAAPSLAGVTTPFGSTGGFVLTPQTGTMIADGSTFTVNNVVFEFDNDGTVGIGNRPVGFLSADPAGTITGKVVNTITAANLPGVNAVVASNNVLLTGIQNLDFTNGFFKTPGETLTAVRGDLIPDARTFTVNNIVFEFDKNGTFGNNNRQVLITDASTPAEVASAMAAAVNAAAIPGVRAIANKDLVIFLQPSIVGTTLTPITVVFNSFTTVDGPQLTALPGAEIQDGQFFILNTRRFEFDSNNVFTGTRIPFTAASSSNAIAAAIVTAINGANIPGIRATAAGNVVTLQVTSTTVNLFAPPLNESQIAKRIYLTSFRDDAIGGNDDGFGTDPRPGDWGGVVFRDNSDLEANGVFMNAVMGVELLYGGGQVTIDNQLASYAPLHLDSARPLLANNVIRSAAGSAISANPNSFEESLFGDYNRVGPEIYGNRTIENQQNGLFIRVSTPVAGVTEKLSGSARFDDTDIVHILTESLTVAGATTGPIVQGGRLVARPDGRLAIDPGIIVKLQGARIEVEAGAQLIAEGLDGNAVIFTSLRDDTYGAGGSFDSSGDGAQNPAAAGQWGGIYFHPTSKGSLDFSLLRYAGGQTPIEGGFDLFNPIEIRQADVRIANSTIRDNAGGLALTDRNGRGRNTSAVIYVLGAQPVIVNNRIFDNGGQAISIDVNSMTATPRPDLGRTTGNVGAFTQFDDNVGPLIRENRLIRDTINGLIIRGGVVTTASVWDDTDIVHVILDEIIVDNLHTYGGLRLQSSDDESLVIKLRGANAGFTAQGTRLDIDDRIGGSVQVIGRPGFQVIMTSLDDCTVGAGFTPDGVPGNDTLNSGGCDPKAPQPVGNSGAVLIDGGDRDDFGHGDALPGPDGQLGTTDDINQDGWLFIQQMIEFARRGSRNNAPRDVLVIGADLPTGGPFGTGRALEAIRSATIVQNLNLDVVNDAQISTVNFNNYKIIYVPSDQNTFGGIEDTEIALLAARKTEVQNFVNSGGSLVALTEGFSATPYSWLELPLPFVVGTNFPELSFGLLRKTQAAIDAGFTITDQEINNGTPYHNNFLGPAGFNGLVPFVLNTGRDGIAGNADDEVITLGLASGSFGIGVVNLPGAPGDWRGLRFTENSNDRNVALIPEKESGTAVLDVNSLTTNAQVLGTLAPNELSGDENQPLGFEIHGLISTANRADNDVYSFIGTPGTEVWIDIDQTAIALDSVVELIDSQGNVLARSNDSFSEQADPSTFPVIPGGNTALPLQKDPFVHQRVGGSDSVGDLYSTNPRDAGMRVVLPGTPANKETYYVRVSSANGQSRGQYKLQIRLRQQDEFPGSTVRQSTIKFAGTGIDVVGLPGHSPLVGDAAEVTNDNTNEGFTNGVDLGNLLQSDRNNFSAAGSLANQNDVDWYSFTLDHRFLAQAIQNTPKTWSTVFDIDYADGLTRPDTQISVFDTNGNLIYIGRDSDIVDDRNLPSQGSDLADLTRGSVGQRDPFIGSVNLQAQSNQRYFVAVHSARTLPNALQVHINGGGNNRTVKLEPISSMRRVVEDHIGFTGFTSGTPGVSTGVVQPTTGAILGVETAQELAATVRPFALADVPLYVSTAGNLRVVDPSTGATEYTVGGYTTGGILDIAMRSDGQLFGVRQQVGAADQVGELQEIDPANAATTVIGNDAILNTTLNSDFVDAIAYRRTGGATGTPTYDLFSAVRIGGGSTLVRNNPATYTATAAPFRVIGSISVGAAGDVGITTGMAIRQGQLFGVSNTGAFYSINEATGRATLIANFGVPFAGLSMGPQNLDFDGNGVGGDLADTFFAIDNNGNLRAFDVAGAARAVFDTNVDGVFENTASTGVTGVTGLAFSPLDFNLWHPTQFRSNDEGHGINSSADQSRLSSNLIDHTVAGRTVNERQGGVSFYFGLEEFAGNPVGRYLTYGQNAQYGITQTQIHNDLASTPEIGDNYNLPGGATGSLVTNSFSLAGSTNGDRPTLYFNYYLNTEDTQSTTNTMRDSARVFISADGGQTWSLLATNNQAANAELPPVTSVFSDQGGGDARQGVQQLFDTTDNNRGWRQARVDLGTFAGQNNLRLRFDFSTAGTQFDPSKRGSNQIAGDAFGDLTNVNRARNNAFEGFYIDDIIVGFAERGETVTGAPTTTDFFNLANVPGAPATNSSGPYQLEIRRGDDTARLVEEGSSATVIDPNRVIGANDRLVDGFTIFAVAGSGIVDGQTFQISDGTRTITFEFDRNNSSTLPNVAIPYALNDSPNVIANKIASAINSVQGFGVTATTTSVGGTSRRVDLVGATTVNLGSTPVSNLSVEVTGATVISESGGVTSSNGQLRREGDVSAPLTVSLAAIDPVTGLPSTRVNLDGVSATINVNFAAGSAVSSTFAINSIDNASADGAATVLLVASAPSFSSVSQSIDVTDDETPTLTLVIAGTKTFAENAGASAISATVTRNTLTTTDLVVSLQSLDPSESTAATTTVTILAGQSSATFSLTAVNDNIIDGSQTFGIVASSVGFRSGRDQVTVTDDGADTIPLGVPLWVAQGPAPQELFFNIAVPPNNPVSGAAHALAAHPTDPNILYMGAVNGGIWRTTNATSPNGPTWVTLTDTQNSLSVGALEFDPTDASRQTLIVGIGRHSSLAFDGGELRGLLRTTNGGTTWTEIAPAILQGHNISGVAARGNLILAAANNFFSAGGLFRSTDGGANFTLVSGTNGLTAGAVSDLVADPSNNNRFYAAVLQQGIFRTDDGGATWTNVTPAGVTFGAGNNNIEMAVHASGLGNAVYAGIMINGSLTSFVRSANQGTSWQTMDIPSTNENGTIIGIQPRPKLGSQGAIHFSIVADPGNPNLVYVGGDRQPRTNGDTGTFPNSIGATSFSGRLFRGDASQSAGNQWVHLTDSNALGATGGGTANGTSPHPDSREMVFNALGQIVEADDGGVYLRTNPQNNTGDWSSLNGNLQNIEFHSVAFDGTSRIIFGGTQDNGTPVQESPGSLTYNDVTSGDGGVVVVDDSSALQSIRYVSSQFLGGFSRLTFDANNVQTASAGIARTVVGGGPALVPQFYTPLALNRVNPARLLIAGANFLYESTDRGDTVTSLGVGGNAATMEYGGFLGAAPNPDVLYAGVGAQVLVRTTAGGPLTPAPGYTGGGVRDIILNPTNWQTAIVVDFGNVWMTTNAGQTFTNITNNLGALTRDFRSIEFVPNSTGGTLFVGTGRGVYQTSAATPGAWSRYGLLLPNAPITTLEFDRTAQILLAGTLGRGAFTVSPNGGAADITVQIVGPAAIQETGVTQSTARISRVGTTGDVVLTVASSSNKVTLNGTGLATLNVTIPDGQSSVDVTLQSANNAIADGTETVFITATSSGFNGIAAAIDVLDDDAAALTVTIDSPATFVEGSGAAVLQGTVTRNTPTNRDQTVFLYSNDNSEATVAGATLPNLIATVVIPAGQTSVRFSINAIDEFISDGARNVNIVAAANGFRSGQGALVVNPDSNTSTYRRLGDRNVVRDQGQLIITENIITRTNTAIAVDSVVPANDGFAIGAVRNFFPQNVERLVPGVVISNNLIVRNQNNGVTLQGQVSTDVTSPAPIPFARVINNTFVGDIEDPRGTGVAVSNSASPTILNNIFVNLVNAITVDNTATPVIGTNLYGGNTNNGPSGNQFDLFVTTQGTVTPINQIFVDAANGNYYLRPGSLAIDSSQDSLQDRQNYVAAKGAIDMAPSPILAPDFDLLGQFRVNDPDQSPPPGLGDNVFKDRGAIDRVDFVGPKVAILNPADNDGTNDRNPAVADIVINGPVPLTEFRFQFSDLGGIGIDPNTVSSSNITVVRDGTPLIANSDYFVSYNVATQILRITTANATFASGRYIIAFRNDSQGILDKALNRLQSNRNDLSTSFVIDYDLSAPTAALVSPLDNNSADNDPSLNRVITSINPTQIQVRLSDVVSGIQDDSVALASALTNPVFGLNVTFQPVDGSPAVPLVLGTNFNFAYDRNTDTITLTPIGSTTFANGQYTITLGDGQAGGAPDITDVAGNRLANGFFNIAIRQAVINVTSGTPLTVAEDGTVTGAFNVQLSGRPTSPVTMNLTTDGETSVNLPTLLFTNGNWNNPMNVTVFAVNDDKDEANTHSSVVTFRTQSQDPIWNNILVTLNADVLDNDTSALLVNVGGSVDVSESGATDSVQIRLQTQPTAPVTVTLTPTTPNPQVTVSQTTLVFSTSDWNLARTVTVGAIDDRFDEAATHVGSFSVAVTSTADTIYGALLPQSVNVNIADNDTTALTVVQSNGTTVVTEGGNNDSFTVALSSQPTSDVVLSLTPDQQVTVGQQSLTFTTTNWSQPQTVTVSAVNDPVDEATTHAGNVRISVQTTTDPTYAGLAAFDLAVTVNDNDSAAVLVTQSDGATVVREGNQLLDTVSLVLATQPTAAVTINLGVTNQLTVTPNVVTFTPANWNVAQTVQLGATNDNIDQADPHFGTLSFTVASGDANYNAIPVASVEASILDPANYEVTPTGPFNVAEGGATATVNVRLTSQPSGTVTMTVTPTAQLGVDKTSLVFTPTNWETPQPLVISAIDDNIAELGAQSGTVTIQAVSGDGLFNVLPATVINLNIADNDSAGVVVTQSGNATAVAEGGFTDTVSVRLTSQPTSTVTVNFGLDSQVASQNTQLIFDASNWNIDQTITVSAVDDSAVESQPHTGRITISFASSDANYQLATQNIDVAVSDNDSPGVIVQETNGNSIVREGLQNDTITVVLASRPSADVTISLSTTLGLATSIGTLTFTNSNWNIPQLVTLSAANDNLDNVGEPRIAVLSFTVSSADNSYAGRNVPSVNVSVFDSPVLFVVQELEGTPASPKVLQSGQTQDVKYRLTTQPSTNVTVTLTPNNLLALSSRSLTFTPSNWNVDQTVVVSVAQTAPNSPNAQIGQITASITSVDPLFSGLASTTTSIPVLTQGAVGSIVLGSPDGVNLVVEGGAGDTITVALNRQPTADVNVTVTPDAQLTASGGTTSITLTFTPANFNTPQVVNIGARDDSNDEGNHTGTLALNATSTDALFSGKTATLTVNITDNDGPAPRQVEFLAGNVQQGTVDKEVVVVDGGSVIIINAVSGATLANYRPTDAATFSDASDRTVMGDIDGDGVAEIIQFNRPSSSGGELTGVFYRVLNAVTGQVIKTVNYTDQVAQGVTYAQSLGGLVDPEDGLFDGHFTSRVRNEVLFFNRTNQEAGRTALVVLDVETGRIVDVGLHNGQTFGGWIDTSDETIVSDTNFDGLDDLVIVNRVPDPQNFRSTPIGFIGMVSFADIGGRQGNTIGFYRFFNWNFARLGESGVFPGYDDSTDRAIFGQVINNGKPAPVIGLVNTNDSSPSTAAYAILEPAPIQQGVPDSFQLITTIFNNANNANTFLSTNRFLMADVTGDAVDEVLAFNPTTRVVRTFQAMNGQPVAQQTVPNPAVTTNRPESRATTVTFSIPPTQAPVAVSNTVDAALSADASSEDRRRHGGTGAAVDSVFADDLFDL